MNSAVKEVAFPPSLPWEEFTETRVTIEELRQRAANAQSILFLARLTDKKSPILDRTALAELVTTTARGLPPEAGHALARDLSAIGAWYLLPAARKVADADLDATREYLAYLSQQGRPAFKALHHILSLLAVPIEQAIAANEDFASHGGNLPALIAKNFLRDVERLLPQLIQLVSAKRAGRRSNFVLNHSARLAAAAVHDVGLTLQPHCHTLKQPDPYITGTGKDVFLGFFDKLAPRVASATLARSLLDAKPSAKKNAAKTRPIKVGAPDG